MDISIFTNKENIPTSKDLVEPLGETYLIWEKIRQIVLEKYPDGKEEWNFPGKKYGWSFRIKDKKRAIIYFLPRDGYFMAAFVFGKKAFDQIMETDISEKIKTDLQNARVYAEGRGVRIDVKDEQILKDIEKLVEIKLQN